MRYEIKPYNFNFKSYECCDFKWNWRITARVNHTMLQTTLVARPLRELPHYLLCQLRNDFVRIQINLLISMTSKG